MTDTSTPDIAELIRQNRNEWLAIDGVEAVGQSEIEGTPCIKLYLSKDVAVPNAIQGVSIIKQIAGKINKQELD